MLLGKDAIVEACQWEALKEGWAHREGSLYGCGSNLHGQLPLEKGVGAPSVTSQSTSPGTSYTAYSTDEDSIQRLLLASTSESTADEDAAHLMFSGDVPVPTRICLPFDQVPCHLCLLLFWTCSTPCSQVQLLVAWP